MAHNSFRLPIECNNITFKGDKVAVEFIDKEFSDGGIVMPDHDNRHDDTMEAIVVCIGDKCSQRDQLEIGSKVLVKNFVGALPVRVGDKMLRLYNTSDILAILTGSN